MKYTTLLIISLFTSTLAMAQTEVTNIIFDRDKLDEVGDTIQFLNADSTYLAPNAYEYKMINKKNIIYLFFTIIEQGMVDGIIRAVNYKNDTLMECYVNKNRVQHYKKYNPMNKSLDEETFKQGDTTIIKYYNKYGQVKSEYRLLEKEEIYNWNCSYSSETDSLVTCMLDDKLRGIYEFYQNGVLQERVITKTSGLAKGIAKEITRFDGNEKMVSKEIYYTNEQLKTINKDGTYTIKKDDIINEYNKSGKLINSYQEMYISI